jgi:Transposase
VKAYSYRRVKNDARDAADLADLLRMGRLPEAWITPPEIRELRELTRYRQKLVGLRTSCKDQVHAVLAKLGIQVTCSDLFGAWGWAWLDELRLPQPYAGKVTSLRQLIGELNTEITMLTEVIGDVLAGHPGYLVIQQLPGIGPVLAAIIIAETGFWPLTRNCPMPPGPARDPGEGMTAASGTARLTGTPEPPSRPGRRSPRHRVPRRHRGVLVVSHSFPRPPPPGRHRATSCHASTCTPWG